MDVIDLVILCLEGDKLDFDAMQFAYQLKSSTTICTWTVNSAIDHFFSRGSQVFGAAIDTSKAFDMVDWKTLLMNCKLQK